MPLKNYVFIYFLESDDEIFKREKHLEKIQKQFLKWVDFTPSLVEGSIP